MNVPTRIDKQLTNKKTDIKRKSRRQRDANPCDHMKKTLTNRHLKMIR